MHTVGNKHVAFVVEHVETFAEELKSRGADIVWVQRNPHGANIFIRDNAGNLIEFLEEPLPTGLPARLCSNRADGAADQGSKPPTRPGRRC